MIQLIQTLESIRDVVEKGLKSGKFASSINSDASIFLSAVIGKCIIITTLLIQQSEYVSVQLLSAATKESQECKHERIAPQHLQHAIRNNKELSKCEFIR